MFCKYLCDLFFIKVIVFLKKEETGKKDLFFWF
jgi:hypothetical protein